ncbi:MAG: hypothetical protein J7521_07490 [Caulobacter sp.]|nr:hypothetical protein [Caulobacter sp.]
MSRASERAGLSVEQLGHLAHFDNLSRQPTNDWSLMKGRGVGQDDFGAYRFQLAYMAYGLALTHIHRMPAAPGVFKPIFERLFEKLLLPEVWLYWHNVSRGGSVFNAHLAHTYKEEWDPVGRDNIMYSAYVQSLALLYNYVFGDDRYAKPGAITFKHWSYFWGGEPKVFEYDQNSLNEHLYWLMVESGFIGVACEPNCVFQICNQPAILGFRLHDLLTGGSRATEVTEAYEAAWGQFGRVGENGHYHLMVSADTHEPRRNLGKAPWVDAWVGALMNMWNRDFVREHYPAQLADLIAPGLDGALSVRSSPRPEVMGQVVVNDDCDFGWVAAWASEMGDQATLEGLLAHADRFMAPTWRQGGLYYPRNDAVEDSLGNRTLVEPHTGNCLLGYARLNVPDGLWRLYNEPLAASFHTDPAVVAIEDDVALSRAVFEDDALNLCVARRDDRRGGGDLTIGRLAGRGAWSLRMDGAPVAKGEGPAVNTSQGDWVFADADGLHVRAPARGAHRIDLVFA